MRKVLSILTLLFMLFGFMNVTNAVDFTVTEPAGSTNASDIDYWVATVNNAALAVLDSNYRRDCSVVYDSASTLKVLAGEIALPNSAGTTIVWRKNTSVTTVTWADIDAGVEASSTQYYVYALGDAAATTFTIKISTSSSAPAGATYYRKIGYFYNNSGSDIVSVGNIKGGDVGNKIYVNGTSDITTTSSSYTDMTDMVLYFVGTGRPVKITYTGDIANSGVGNVNSVVIDIDSSNTTGESAGAAAENGAIYQQAYPIEYTTVLTAGTHTIKAQWKTSGGTAYQGGSTYSARYLSAEEI